MQQGNSPVGAIFGGVGGGTKHAGRRVAPWAWSLGVNVPPFPVVGKKPRKKPRNPTRQTLDPDPENPAWGNGGPNIGDEAPEGDIFPLVLIEREGKKGRAVGELISGDRALEGSEGGPPNERPI